MEPPPLGNHGSRSERTDSRELSRAGAARVDSASDEREIRELARRYFLWPRNVTVREQEEAEEAQEAEAEKPRWRERGSEAEAEAEAEAEKLRHKKRLKIKAHRHTHSHKERRTSTAAARRAFFYTCVGSCANEHSPKLVVAIADAAAAATTAAAAPLIKRPNDIESPAN